VVDDDGAVCEALAVLAESAGYAASRFTSGEDFLAALDRLPPGCAVVDVTMPVVDGPAVLAAVKARRHAAAIIFVTAYDEPHRHSQLLRDGGRAVLLKPVDPVTLLNEIAKALSPDSN
jgi:FixJ family two-component response regulator